MVVYGGLTVLSVGGAITITAACFHYGMFGISAWHPALMSAGVLVFLTQGVLAYIANYGAKLPVEDRAGRRTVHGVLQLLAVSCLCVGYMVAYTGVRGGILTHDWPGVPDSAYAHVWLGYITLGLMGVQFVVGVLKLRRRERDGRAVLKWHGQLGPLLYLLALLTIMFGVNARFSADHTGFAVGITITLCAVFLGAVVALFCGPRRAKATSTDRAALAMRDGPRDLSEGLLPGPTL